MGECTGVVSIVVPARDEEDVLPACLDSLLKQDFAGKLTIIVVANGCRDRTADVARGWMTRFHGRGRELRVIESQSGSKPLALNLGDAACLDGGVRMYLDADVQISVNAVATVAQILSPATGKHYCTPAILVRRARSLVTRCYSRVWESLPYVQEGVGCGCYAVSAEGRQRWGRFPPIVADDKFVRLHFAPVEREVASDAHFVFHMPEGFRELVAIRGRWCRGSAELGARFPQLTRGDRRRHVRLGRFLIERTDLWVDLPVFVAVYALGRVAAYRGRRLSHETWERAVRARIRPGLQFP